MIEHFLKQGTLESLTAPLKKIYTKELLGQFVVAQPTPNGGKSIFADIPVFGVNRIAVRVPRMSDDPQPKYLSFSLSEFRTFAQNLREVCGISGLGNNTSIPMTDEYATLKCHVSNGPVLELKNLNYYEKDPAFRREISGWRCAACGIVISEASRAETKLGGPLGKTIAKAKCPKCTKKFGSVPLYVLAGSSNSAGSAKPDANQEAVTA